MSTPVYPEIEARTEEQERAIGQAIAEVLGLKLRDGVYKTQWGTKTDLGLYRMLKRLVLDGE